MTVFDNSEWPVDSGGFHVMPEEVAEQLAEHRIDPLPTELSTSELRDRGHDEVLARWQSQFIGIVDLPARQQPDYAAGLALKAFDLAFDIVTKSNDEKNNKRSK